MFQHFRNSGSRIKTESGTISTFAKSFRTGERKKHTLMTSYSLDSYVTCVSQTAVTVKSWSWSCTLAERRISHPSVILAGSFHINTLILQCCKPSKYEDSSADALLYSDILISDNIEKKKKLF